MDKKGGWIKLYRSVTENWVFDNDEPKCSCMAWIDLLLMANHENHKIRIHGEVLEIRKGQKMTSLRKLADRWNWSVHRVDRFLLDLQSDGMIFLEKTPHFGTLITVSNYADYQAFSESKTNTDGHTDGYTDRHTDGHKAGMQTDTQTAYKQEGKNVKNDKEPKKNKPRPWGGMLEPE
jgi:DNA replication protein DnaD